MNSNLTEFDERLNSEEGCIELFFEIKWPDGFSCPRCGHREACTIRSRRLPLFECRSCRHQTSLTSGTILEKSRTPLRKWMIALFSVSDDAALNAAQLAPLIDVTYKTAWSMLHKIRTAIHSRDSKQPLKGMVSAALNFYGKPYNPSVRLHHQEYPVFVGVSSESANGTPAYLKMKLIHHTCMNGKIPTRQGMSSFTEKHVEQNVNDLVFHIKRFQIHAAHPLKKLFNEANAWLRDTFGGIGPKHLQLYLDEFCFRYNCSIHKSSARMELLRLCNQRLVGSAAT